MRCVALANNWVGLKAVQFLAADPATELVGLVLNQSGKQKLATEIVAASGLDDSQIVTADELGSVQFLEKARDWNPDCGLSAFFGHILKADFLALFPEGVVNLHTSFLPFNRGAYPNVWPILDGTPAGVTMHMIDEGVDTGDVLVQKEIPVLPSDTGQSLNERLQSAMVELFESNWHLFVARKLIPRPQNPSEGTTHRASDVSNIDEIDLGKIMPARELINLLRARTYPPHRGAYFVENGRKYYLRLEIEEE